MENSPVKYNFAVAIQGTLPGDMSRCSSSKMPFWKLAIGSYTEKFTMRSSRLCLESTDFSEV
ncbi:hypothetical protein ANCCAN_18429 [Ancylostoma caninum]|uniref:Uncharacterized protein n=1 Tax=Ancylostoma caninum TaxID=29170 RepID=A0A368FU14_ANCCA|nr:hypothetical protein ANCCAN_18429 [Ancylostoma caninum]